jgi:hypothetical protein
MICYIILTSPLGDGTGFAFCEQRETAPSTSVDIQSEQGTYLGYVPVNMQRILNVIRN